MGCAKSAYNAYTVRMGKVILAILFSLFMVSLVSAQEVHQELKEIVTANITQILSDTERVIEGTNTVVRVQRIEALLTSGTHEGRTVIFENEIVPLEQGDAIYVNYLLTIQGDEYFMFKDYKRQPQLLFLLILFSAILIFFAKMQGARALLSLGASVGIIWFILVPILLSGFSPVLASAAIASIILAVVLFFTHGINPRSVIAFLGTVGAVVATCMIAYVSVGVMKLTGFGNDAAVYLNFSTNGTLDFAGLLLGSIIIGILGVLDDVSITQASVVQELRHANAGLSIGELYRRAINVGKDHIGSLVNTLALAYIGVSLPLVLLFATSNAEFGLWLNQEVVAAELVRILVGSIGLVLAVPLTTVIAAWWFAKHGVDEKDISSHGHTHSH